MTSPSLELANNISLVRNEISAYEMLDTKRVMFRFKQRWHQLGKCSSRLTWKSTITSAKLSRDEDERHGV